MALKLVVIEGPIGASECVLDSFPVTIGRRRDNRISIADPAVSRYHCHIVRVNGHLRLRDLGSQNGVEVNGRPTVDHDLKAGDQIQIGAALLRCDETSDDADSGSSEPAADSALRDTRIQLASPLLAVEKEAAVPETVEFDPDDTKYLRRSDSSSGNEDRSARDLRALLNLCRQIQQADSPEIVQRRLLEALFGAIPAERGAVVLSAPGSVRLGEAVCLDRLRGPVDLKLSRTTLASVIDDGRVFLRNRIQGDPEGLPESLIAGDVQAALAAPLTFHGRIIGALYLDTTRADQPFDRQDLDLATAAAAAAAGVLEGAFRHQVLQRGLRAAWLEWGESPLSAMPSMRQALDSAVKAAAGSGPVLVTGEVGSGRRALAASIHAAGSSADGPFVSIHCAGRDPEAIEVELWGVESRPGKLARAAGGTLFVVEIGALPAASQARLVALISEDSLAARLIAATSLDLRALAVAGDFRDDLLYRLGPAVIQVPPLRSRRGDVMALAEHFAKRAAELEGRPFTGFSDDARAAIENYGWPGNIRELAHALEWAVGVRTENLIELVDLPSEVSDSASAPGYHERVKDAKRRILVEALDRSKGSVPAAAAELGINRTYLHRLIRNLEVKQDPSGAKEA